MHGCKMRIAPVSSSYDLAEIDVATGLRDRSLTS